MLKMIVKTFHKLKGFYKHKNLYWQHIITLVYDDVSGFLILSSNKLTD